MRLEEGVRKLSAQMNVELMVGGEVFGQYADGITSQSHSGDPLGGTENIGTLGTLRSPPLLKAWHTHSNMLLRGADSTHFEPKSVRGSGRSKGEYRPKRPIYAASAPHPPLSSRLRRAGARITIVSSSPK